GTALLSRLISPSSVRLLVAGYRWRARSSTICAIVDGCTLDFFFFWGKGIYPGNPIVAVEYTASQHMLLP
uniref:Uncharacterized protein n=1 Tax=Oryza brachyantha TaxID=4533 RepID=J3N028_ORYBR